MDTLLGILGDIVETLADFWVNKICKKFADIKKKRTRK